MGSGIEPGPFFVPKVLDRVMCRGIYRQKKTVHNVHRFQ
ncbi:Uncharacterised protein [Serratia fonticola]|nr:Uncharacterised protein [Serratia fonticola]